MAKCLLRDLRCDFQNGSPPFTIHRCHRDTADFLKALHHNYCPTVRIKFPFKSAAHPPIQTGSNLVRHQQLTKMDLKEKMLAEIERRRESLLDQVTLPIGDEMLLRRQLDGVEQALYAGRLPEEDWEQHQFHWLAHCAEQERSLIRRSSHLMLTFEDMERHEPNIFIEDATVLELLHWWRDEGGREEYLGQLTIAERRELEEQERQWREKRP